MKGEKFLWPLTQSHHRGLVLAKRVLMLLILSVSSQPLAKAAPAVQAVARTEKNSMKAHAQLLEKAHKGRIDIYFEGDSIVRRWGATDYPQFLANWKQNFYG